MTHPIFAPLARLQSTDLSRALEGHMRMDYEGANPPRHWI